MPAETPKSGPDPDQKKAMNLYAILAVALVLSVLPYIAAAFLSLVFITAALIAAYVIRNGSQPESLIENHATFIIRTIWIGGLYACITMMIGSIYMLNYVDNGPLNICIDKIMTVSGSTQMIEFQGIVNGFSGCMDEFIRINMRTFITSAFITAGPVLLFFIVRLARGLARIKDGYRIASPQSWL